MKLFNWKKKVETATEETNKTELPWISAENNPWGREILDLRPLSQTMLSTSKDPRMAENAISYNSEDGSSFFGQKPANDRTISTSTRISFPVDRVLYPGVLFTPNTMEHKWAIYYDGESIYFVRSWLREVLVVAHTEQRDGELIVTSITGKFVDEKEPEFTESILNFLLISHALGETVPAPLPVYMQAEPYNAGLWAFSAYGNMAHLGIFDYTFMPTPGAALHTHTVLHIAAVRGDMEKIEKCLAAGIPFDCLAGDGSTPVHWAVSGGSGSEVLKKFLEAGADPDIRSGSGTTPLMTAIQSNVPEYVHLLLDAGASVNAADGRGFTALHRAAEMGLTDLVKLLLDNGADKTIVAQEHTALSLAEMREQKEVVKLLKD